MGETMQAAVFWIFGVAALGQGLLAVRELGRAGAAFAEAWREEVAVRTCALVAAGSANLRDAAAAAAALDPAATTRLDAAAAVLEAALRGAYPTALHPDAAGLCRLERGSGLAASLHEQRHPGQAPVWPNWVPRFAWD